MMRPTSDTKPPYRSVLRGIGDPWPVPGRRRFGFRLPPGRSGFWVGMLATAVSCAGLFVICNSVRAKETEKADVHIKKLQKERLEILEDMYKIVQETFANARSTYEDFQAIARDVFAARLDCAETREDRLLICDQMEEEAQEWYAAAKTLMEASRGPGLSVYRARAYVLEIQIAREKIAAGE